ncbi:WbqC family protein [Virgibacillus siamensis]|uniref:WbqC family protein n=1 Tax=Virgibacillus siamensis TaxID=480071 RepID=A0ABP3RAV2_9BACI
MKLAIMQPYLFPYIGYFQLIHAVDKFVVYDDVQYIKGGWINRNKILVNHEPHVFTFSVKKDSLDTNINERYFSQNFNKEKSKFLKTVKESYGKADNFDQVYTIIKSTLEEAKATDNIATVITRSIKLICDYLEINTPIVLSSNIDKSHNLSREDRVIEMNRLLEANHYINAIGGTDLYSKDYFSNYDLKIDFLKSNAIHYEQTENDFVPNLSIIDVLMHNSKHQIRKFLDEYTLV